MSDEHKSIEESLLIIDTCYAAIVMDGAPYVKLYLNDIAIIREALKGIYT